MRTARTFTLMNWDSNWSGVAIYMWKDIKKSSLVSLMLFQNCKEKFSLGNSWELYGVNKLIPLLKS